MRLFNLALRNIKLNSRKYAMYIFSMGFSVFTVYTFLALMENETVGMAFKYDMRYRSLLTSFGVIILIFVLFFLISSNNSFIRARKKEISMYALFGMSNYRIGKLLFLETIIVGTVTLFIGIGTGVFFSKLMAMFLLKLSLSGFAGDIAFSISMASVFKTAIIFFSIFCVMGLTGFFSIYRFELVDLFKAEKVSEGRYKGSIGVLILSLVLMGTGYGIACSDNVIFVVMGALPILGLVILGTYLFFWGGMPKVLSLIKRNKNFYYKGINLISASAVSHRMKTIASVMATIAVLSAVAVTAIATGFTLYSNAEMNTYSNVGYDMYYYGGDEEAQKEINRILKENDSNIIDEYKTVLYRTNPNIDAILAANTQYISEENNYLRVYSQKEYNHLISISKSNLEQIKVGAGEGLYVYPYSTEDIKSEIMGQKIDFDEKKISLTQVRRSAIAMFDANHILVLNDRDYELFKEKNEIIPEGNDENRGYVTAITYKKALTDGKLNASLEKYLEAETEDYRSAYTLYNESMESFGLICFIGFFMSGVFILMTASLLYFKQIMAAEEERNQYKMLRRIGMDEIAEKQVIKNRLLPIFFIPLCVGIVHSIFAMKTADTVIFSNMIPVENSYLSVLGFSAIMYLAYAAIYGGFYLITKSQYQRIIRN